MKILRRSTAAILLIIVTACNTPTAPSGLTGVTSRPAEVTALPAVADVGPSTLPPPTVPIPQVVPTCTVSQADVDHARRLLRILTGELQRGVGLRFALEEYKAPFVPSGRMLHGFLHYGQAGDTAQLLEGTLTPNTLRFGSAQAAGWALWQAAGQLTITADIYVNGIKVAGCPPRTGKITGRIDLEL